LEIGSPEAADNIQGSHGFSTGDKVVAVGGELTNLKGKVTLVEGNKISVMPSHEDIKV
jgi:hypothetical protein